MKVISTELVSCKGPRGGVISRERAVWWSRVGRPGSSVLCCDRASANASAVSRRVPQ